GPCFVQALAFSADGTRLHVGTLQAGRRVVAVDREAASASEMRVAAGGSTVAAFGARADTFLGAGDEPGTVALRRTATEAIVSALGAHPDPVGSAAISPRGDRAVVWTVGNEVELWDTSLPAGRSIGRWRHSHYWRATAAFSADGCLVAFG